MGFLFFPLDALFVFLAIMWLLWGGKKECPPPVCRRAKGLSGGASIPTMAGGETAKMKSRNHQTNAGKISTRRLNSDDDGLPPVPLSGAYYTIFSPHLSRGVFIAPSVSPPHLDATPKGSPRKSFLNRGRAVSYHNVLIHRPRSSLLDLTPHIIPYFRPRCQGGIFTFLQIVPVAHFCRLLQAKEKRRADWARRML